MTSMLTTELLEAVSHSVEARLGLHYPRERWSDLERGLGAAAKELGFESTEACARKMAGSVLGAKQIESLAAHLTIGETYFFRDPQSFEALETQVIPAIVQARRGQAKRLRIWSAGCCTGEEPYSIAMALHRALPDFKDWQISILGTDLNPRFLQKAVQGVYGPWSFRGVPDGMKHQFFRQTVEGRFEVLPDIRRMVEFGCLNLAEDVFPSLMNNTNALDIIFCRNVLMYFSREQLRKVIANLHRSLVDPGWLFISAAEASQELFTDFSPAGFSGTAAYRKGGPAPQRAELLTPMLTLEPAALTAVTPTPQPSQPVVAAAAPVLPDFIAEARRLANEGSLAAALKACDQAIETNKLSAASHYLRGVILHEQNAIEEAALAIKRALYLDQNFIVAHFTLGNLMLRLGRSRDAGRCFENARALLRKQSPEAVLPESDGTTAGRMLAILASMQEVAA
ncbi:MAG: CheR family methyltransferase [Prosthecobacter sp.]|uniref:CheR family methyltransferase n=1 Tax=Prosthecobacter sp. TaxID=1965333 RepID=UPI0039005DE6